MAQGEADTSAVAQVLQACRKAGGAVGSPHPLEGLLGSAKETKLWSHSSAGLRTLLVKRLLQLPN